MKCKRDDDDDDASSPFERAPLATPSALRNPHQSIDPITGPTHYNGCVWAVRRALVEEQITQYILHRDEHCSVLAVMGSDGQSWAAVPLTPTRGQCTKTFGLSVHGSSVDAY